MTDENGTIVWNADYKPFGNAEIDPASTIVNHFRLPGQYYDEETGLHYNYYRYYAPGIGRYLRGDPIGLDGGMNLYAYCLNDPVGWMDPWGLYSFQQGLQDTTTYSGIAATASFLIPGGQTAFIVFAGIGVGVKSLEIVLICWLNTTTFIHYARCGTKTLFRPCRNQEKWSSYFSNTQT